MSPVVQTGLSVVPRKGLVSPKKLFEKKNRDSSNYSEILSQHDGCIRQANCLFLYNRYTVYVNTLFVQYRHKKGIYGVKSDMWVNRGSRYHIHVHTLSSGSGSPFLASVITICDHCNYNMGHQSVLPPLLTVWEDTKKPWFRFRFSRMVIFNKLRIFRCLQLLKYTK